MGRNITPPVGISALSKRLNRYSRPLYMLSQVSFACLQCYPTPPMIVGEGNYASPCTRLGLRCKFRTLPIVIGFLIQVRLPKYSISFIDKLEALNPYQIVESFRSSPQMEGQWNRSGRPPPFSFPLLCNVQFRFLPSYNKILAPNTSHCGI